MAISTKQELRKQILDLIKTQKEEDALQKSRIILDKVVALPVFKKAKAVLFYASCKGEVDTFALMNRAIELKKCVLVPCVLKEKKQIIPVRISSVSELTSGSYGIPEPVFAKDRVMGLKDIDLVIVPGVAFDRKNNRLGRGAGFYDRFLSELPSTTPTIALAFDLQVVDALPGLESHDRPVAQVITN